MGKGQQQFSADTWAKLHYLRGKLPMLNFKLFDAIAAFHGESKLEQILADEQLLQRASKTHSLGAPIYLFNFIRALTHRLTISECFDPWLNIMSPILHLPFPNAAGVCFGVEQIELIEELFPEKKISIQQGNGIRYIDTVEGSFDLIISITPMGMRTPVENVQAKTLKGDYGSILLLKSLSHITKSGKAIFLLSPSFFLKGEYRTLLVELGFRIEAIFSLPAGALLPSASISSFLVVASKGRQGRVFVAEISPDERTNKSVIENFYSNKEGKQPELGCLVELALFKSFRTLVLTRELVLLQQQTGFPPTTLVEIATSLKSFREIEPEEIIHLPNSIYIPKIGASEVVTSPAHMRIKPHNYYQIGIDESKANATFVANYFNSPIGVKVRDSLKVGTAILQIPMSNLESCTINLPDLITQLNIIEIDNKIAQFNYRLDDLKRGLWKFPRKHKSILKEVKEIGQEPRLEAWIDRLPFPISSILWRYYATKSDNKKIGHLFHFFEALSEFLAMVMLSGLVQDKEFYRQECHKWIDSNEKFKDWYLRATFGSWNVLTSRLSKSIREYLFDKSKKEVCKAFFGNAEDAFFKILTSKRIVNILDDVSVLRNKWKGHTGVTSENEDKQRLTVLEQHLNELRHEIADGFDEILFISPSSGIFEDGIFQYHGKELIGARTPLQEITVKSLVPLDRRKLYFLDRNQCKPVELLPFIKYVEASDAIYFYTSIESKDVRWVSYHFDKEAELRQPADSDLYKVFDFLKEK
jgi:hypothetical protein